jgi:hypothetical protein
MIALAESGTKPMDIDPLDPELVLLSDLCKLLPGKPKRETPYGWVERGLVNRFTGERVYLQTIDVTTGRATTPAAYRDFIRRLNARP